MRRTAAVLLLLACACGNDKAHAIAYATAHAREIVAATRPLWIRYAANEVPASAYPAVLQPLRPTKIVAWKNGVTIYIDTEYQNVTGLFVRHNPSYVPPRATGADSTDPDYKPLAADVYWLTIPR